MTSALVAGSIVAVVLVFCLIRLEIDSRRRDREMEEHRRKAVAEFDDLVRNLDQPEYPGERG